MCVQEVPRVAARRPSPGLRTPLDYELPIPSQRRRDQERFDQVVRLGHSSGLLVRVLVRVALSGSWALVPTATAERAHVPYHPHVQEPGLKDPVREVVHPHSRLEVRFENPFRCLHLPQ
jgi:hypothetical protein